VVLVIVIDAGRLACEVEDGLSGKIEDDEKEVRSSTFLLCCTTVSIAVKESSVGLVNQFKRTVSFKFIL
jgi:hypothetical protein